MFALMVDADPLHAIVWSCAPVHDNRRRFDNRTFEAALFFRLSGSRRVATYKPAHQFPAMMCLPCFLEVAPLLARTQNLATTPDQLLESSILRSGLAHAKLDQ